MAQLKAPSL
jgi:hypothetical protein